MAEPAAEIAGLTKSFGGTPVLTGVDLTVGDGELVALLGPSGCGKSTLLRLVAGLDRPDTGTVTLAGRVVSGPSEMVAPERRGVGLVFQNGALFPHLDVARNVGYGLERSQRRSGPRIDEMLAMVGMSDVADRSVDSLSGGQQQRVALARALAPSPSLMLMDEPFSNLDTILRTRLRREVSDVVRSLGVSVLFVTHDRDEAFTFADRVAVMRDGRIVQDGAPREVYRRPVDAWVARFVGEANLLPAVVEGGRAQTALGPVDVEAGAGSGGEVLLRPEELELVSPGPDGADATVVAAEYLGSAVMVEVELADGRRLRVSLPGDRAPRPVGTTVSVRRRPDLGAAVVLPG
ncbi:MAG: ABC transporter ATP-binding protein [Acidimicrobiales bacterium]